MTFEESFWRRRRGSSNQGNPTTRVAVQASTRVAAPLRRTKAKQTARVADDPHDLQYAPFL